MGINPREEMQADKQILDRSNKFPQSNGSFSFCFTSSMYNMYIDKHLQNVPVYSETMFQQDRSELKYKFYYHQAKSIIVILCRFLFISIIT